MSFRRNRPFANNRLISEHRHMTFSKCKTAFIKPRLGPAESLIRLPLACHNILTALSSANLSSHCELYWRLFAPLNCGIPRRPTSRLCKASTSRCTHSSFWGVCSRRSENDLNEHGKTDGGNRFEPAAGHHMPLALSCPLSPRRRSYCLAPSCTCRCLPALSRSPRLWV